MSRRIWGFEQRLRDRQNLFIIGWRGFKTWELQRRPPRGQQYTAAARKLLQLSISLQRNASNIGQDHRFVFVSAEYQRAFLNLAGLLQSFVVKEVEVVAALDQLRNHIGAQSLAQFIDHVHVARREMRPRIVVRQIERHVVCRLTLSQQKAEPLQIAREVSNPDPPWVLVVSSTGR